MIEELTPLLLSVALVLVIVLASVLSLLGSVAVLSLYRHHVLRAMAASAGGVGFVVPPLVAIGPAPTPTAARATAGAGRLFDRALREPRIAALHGAIAGLVFALVLTVAAGLAVPEMRTPYRLALLGWGYAWPIVLALVLTGPGGARAAALAVALYFAPLIAITASAVLAPQALPDMFGGDFAALRAATTPFDIARSWLIGNAAPTLLLLLFLNRRLRAVGPLMLGFMTTVSIGAVVVLLFLLTNGGTALMVRLAVASGAQVQWWLLAVLAVAMALFGALGWALLQWLRRGYLRKTLNDRSLTLDAVWLVFGSFYALWLALSGLLWAAIVLPGFVLYKTTGALMQKRWPATPNPARGLTFLRVFSLGARSDRLLDALARHWRRIGSLHLITGPDVAHSTVQPHQLLDFVAGRLASHFVGDARTLEQRLQQRDTAPDRDGWFRINNFFCHADTWQAVLARLVIDGDVVLMDLRSFTAQHAGCVHELRHLVNFVPLGRCVLLFDASTDLAFVRATLQQAWLEIDPRSPNRAMRPEAVALHRFDAGQPALRQLLQRLCDAG
ncbi:MAG: hypothetical protein ABI433_03460 [Burkholderiaceae bacterium]